MYNLLTGKIPTESILRATRPLPSPRELNPAISAKTEAAIIKAMQIIPADRFQSVSEMLAELDFPQVEEEVVKNNISSPEYFEEDETTILFTTRLPQSKGTEDDETVLNNVDLPSVPKKKKRKVTLISLLIIIFASIGSAVALLVQRYKTAPPVAEVINTASGGNTEPVQDPVMPDIIEESDTPEVVEEKTKTENENEGKTNKDQQDTSTKPVDKPETVQQQPASVKPEVKPVVKDVEQPVTVKPERSKEEINAEYLSLINSGKDKMAAADFSGAKADFTKASEIKMTKELFDLIGDCKLKENENDLAERKAQYEEKMSFGKYIIVRKKSNGNYGAVDADAIEQIPCKYKNVGKADNGRAFERADGLFDIYNTEGVLINQGVPYY